MSSKVKVAVRLRPFNRRELDLGTKCVVDMDETQTILFSSRDRKQTKTFAFDHCFWSMEESNHKYATQEKVYKCLGADVLENAFEGYNACIFAYGQTGSGKTYTMMGSLSQKGVIPRLCDELFERISNNEDENITYKVEVSYIEIYNEKVRDLLCPRGNSALLRVREHKILGPYVEGLTKLVVSSFEDIETLMIEGNKSRTVAATNMNTESSRSHAVFNIVLTRYEYDKDTECIGEKVSKMSLVDLAGSERASKSGAEGERLKEGSNINRSLVTLGQVISSLADQSLTRSKKVSHVPYRDSVLTWLLKDNLGGNSKTVMVATVSPAADNYEETLSTLRYADRAKRIVNHAVVNEDPNAKIIRELREEVDRLKRLLAAKMAGKSHVFGPGETTVEIEEMLSESEKLMSECTMTWEQKEKQTEKIQQERHRALEEMGISVQSSGIAVEKSKFYLVNLNADPSMNELLVYYLKEHTLVGRPDAVHTPDIQLGGLGILHEHCQMDIEDNEVYATPLAKTGTCVNGKLIEERTQLRHGDRILWGNNHYFRVNCPRLPGSEQQVEQPVDFQFAQTEMMMNEISSGPLSDSVKALEEQYKAEKQGALDKQRQMYEEKIEELRNQIGPMGRQLTERTASIGSFSSGYGSSRMSWCEDRDSLIQFERKPLVLKEEVIKANALVREANQLSEEMGKETEFAVTLQIPTSSLSFGRSRSGFSSEVAIVVKHKSKGTQIWSYDKLANKIYDMRDVYNQCVEDNIPFSETDENLDLFFEVECHTLIGVANVFLECLLHDVSHEYAAPIISQQGEVCGRLKVEVSRISDKAQKASRKNSHYSNDGNDDEDSPGEEDDLLGTYDEDEEQDNDDEDIDDDELVKGSLMHVEVKVIEAYDLPPALCNYVFCQYKFWNDDNTIVVPPINASISNPGPKTNTMIFEHKQLFDMQVTEKFVEFASEGSLAIEVWGNRMKGFDSNSKVNWNWNVEPQQKGLHDRWAELIRKMHLWVEILEINDQGVYSPVELHPQKDNQTGGIFQLRQGHSRRIIVQVQPAPRSGSLPMVCNMISAVYIGSVCMRSRNQQPLDSYQEKDLSILREKWSTSLMKRREYLDDQIHSLIDKSDKSVSDKERESWMIDQWVCLTEERNAVLVPLQGSGIPGAPPIEGTVPMGMEKFSPVIFLDLNDDVRSGCLEEGGPAGVDSTLTYENSDNMVELPIIKYDQKQVSATVLWDSSIHDSPFLNRVTSSNERVYLILKVIVRLASPISMDLVLRKRISVKIYKRQSWKDSILRRIAKDIITRCGVTYELVSHIPRQPGEETEERESLAQMAAQAVGEGEEEDESVLRKYSKGISHVESLLALDRLRQEVMVKEKLAAIGKPLRKFASTPNLAAASGDFSLNLSGSVRFDSPENRLWTARGNNRSDFILANSGSFTDPRPMRPTREDVLIDLSQLSEQFSSSPVSSGVTMRNSGGASNSRPSSLLLELETLEEDDSTPSPSPRINKPPTVLFGFDDLEPELADGTATPPMDNVRERSGSADTLTYEDLPTPTPTPPSREDASALTKDSSEQSLLFTSESTEIENLINYKAFKTEAGKPSVELTPLELNEDEDEDEGDIADETSSLLTNTSDEMTKSEMLACSDGDQSQRDKNSSESRQSLETNSPDNRELIDADSQEGPKELVGSYESEDFNVNSLDSLGDLKMGQVICIGERKTGRIRYIGPTEFAPGPWIGVELDTPTGKNDGSVNGQRYFACKPRYGSFVRPEKVFPIESTKRDGASTNQKSSARSSSPSPSPAVLRVKARENRRKNEWKRRSNILF